MFAAADDIISAYKKVVDGEPFGSTFYNDLIQNRYEYEAKETALITTFAILAIIILVMGVFAMSLYMMRQKEKEIAIRKVNGATVGEILVLLGRQSVFNVAIAFVIACPIAWFAMRRWLDGYAYRIDMSWWIFVGAGLAVWLLSLICVLWQSYRAATANPVKALKSE